MGSCDSKDWTIQLYYENPPTVEELFFVKVEITNGKITGEVHKPRGTKISDLIGRCSGFVEGSVPDSSLMSFVFRLKDGAKEIGIFLTGLGVAPPEVKPEFQGGWLAFPPGPDTPGSAERVMIIPGSGDTGTGTGQQT